MERTDVKQKVIARVCPTCSFSTDGHDTLQICPQDGSLLAVKRSDPFLGSVIAGKYILHSKVGEGGYGSVYAAEHIELKRKISVKILRSDLMEDPVRVKRFQVEAQSAAALSHPNLATVYDYGLLDEGNPYLVMEYVDGKTLDEIVHSSGAMPVNQAIDIMKQCCDGLEVAHSSGIVHRDIKPSNIMLVDQPNGERLVKILDFGLAKQIWEEGTNQTGLTNTGETIGTPDYMSPEQCRGEKLDGRSDIYNLGCVFYFILCGRHAFSGLGAVEVMHKQLYEFPAAPSAVHPNSNIPPQVETALLTALAKEPEDRFQEVSQFKAALSNVTPGKVEKKTRWPTGKRKRIAAASSLITTGITCLITTLLIGSVVISSRTGMQNTAPPPVVIDMAGKPVTVAKLEKAAGKASPTSVVLSDQYIESSVFDKLAQYKDLESLKIENCAFQNRDIAKLSGLRKLKTLNARKTGVQGPEISQLPYLENLDLNMSAIPDSGLNYLSCLQNLKSLDVSYSKILGTNFKALRGLPHFEQLNAIMCMSDEGLEQLAQLKSLTKLDISDSQHVTDQGLRNLGNMPQLKSLNITNCTTNQALVSELKTKLPNCEITY